MIREDIILFIPRFVRFALIILVVCLSACQSKISITEDISIVNTNNQTVKKLKLTLSDSSEISVKIKNLITNKEQSLQSPPSIFHETLLAGLKPDQDYEIRVLSKGRVMTKIDTFHTDPIEENVVSIYKRELTPNSFNGYLLTQRRLVKGSVYMIDNEGDLVWYQMLDGQPKLSHWTKNNEVLVLLGNAKHNNSAGNRIVAYTIDGNISYDINLEPLGIIAHHEVIEHEDDLIFLAYDTKPNKVNNEVEEAITSCIIRLTKEGEIVWKWSTFDVKDPTGIPTSEMDGDWGHANSFSFDLDNNILISYRDWNQIWKININTGQRIWVLGENGDFEFKEIPFNGQHAIHLNSNGDYMMFDNGKRNRQSRIVSYNLKNDNLKQTLAINLTEDLYADRMGNVKTLPNGNYLLCSPRSRSIVVLSQSGEKLFHINTGIPDPYRAEFVSSFFNN